MINHFFIIRNYTLFCQGVLPRLPRLSFPPVFCILTSPFPYSTLKSIQLQEDFHVYSYTVAQWLLFFYIYCFIGWCFESTYVSIKSRRLVNRGFIRGPFLPLYGCGAIVMLFLAKPFLGHPVPMFFSGMIGATALEYITGVCMESLFKVRYWDYSSQKFNFQGHICLSSSIAWGFLTIALNTWIHRPVEYVVLLLSPVVLDSIVLILTILVGTDFITSFKTALELRRDLEGMTTVRNDLKTIQKRLDALLSKAGINWEQKKGDWLSKLDTLKERADSFAGDMRSEFADLKERLDVITIRQKQFQKRMNFFKRDMIQSNPTLTSKRYKVELDYLKTYLLEQSRQKKEARKRKKGKDESNSGQ